MLFSLVAGSKGLDCAFVCSVLMVSMQVAICVPAVQACMHAGAMQSTVELNVICCATSEGGFTSKAHQIKLVGLHLVRRNSRPLVFIQLLLVQLSLHHQICYTSICHAPLSSLGHPFPDCDLKVVDAHLRTTTEHLFIAICLVFHSIWSNMSDAVSPATWLSWPAVASTAQSLTVIATLWSVERQPAATGCS